MKIEAWHTAFVILPCLILIHLLVSPFTKVEESFNIQAIHDFNKYGIPAKHASLRLKTFFDHMTFPGAVPRTFIGALVLSGISSPLVQFSRIGLADQQVLARAVLGLLNGLALLSYISGVRKAYGKSAGLWFAFFLASQFHVFYYASRTLPNMFAFGISTVAERYFLPDPTSTVSSVKRTRLAFYLLTLAAVIFRAELALLLTSHALYMLLQSPATSTRLMMIRTIFIPSILTATVAGLVLTVALDSHLWQSTHLLWPELSAFLANIFPPAGSLGASAWGTSPWHWYFSSAIPRLILNPFLLLLIPYGFMTAQRPNTIHVLTPSLLFTTLYSVLPHKETRFLFPIIPPLTLSIALPAAYITTHHARSGFNRLTTYILVTSTLLMALISHTILLPLSSLTYPGASALISLHSLSETYTPQREIHVHFTNLALQTGVTKFLEIPPPKSPLVVLPGSADGRFPSLRSGGTKWVYDKSDNSTGLYMEEEFWNRFDYVVVEDPEIALPVGGWDVVDKIYTPGRPRVLGPDVGRGVLVLGNAEERRERDGVERLVEETYGDGWIGRGLRYLYEVVHDVLREGGWLGGWSVTGGWWVHWGVETRLFVMKRGEK